MKKTGTAAAILMTFTSFVIAKHIVVDLTRQRACAYEGHSPLFCGNISSGKPDHRTPTGHFRVLEKDIDHISSKYPEPNGGAKMHYALRLTASGIAMHLGYVPSYPASHGCIRMQNGFAQRLYTWAHVGTPVLVTGIPPRYVNRSFFGTGAFSQTSRGSAQDILRAFMRGEASLPRTVHRQRSTPRRLTRRRYSHSRRQHHRERHPHPLSVIVSR